MEHEKLVAIGRFTRPHGVRGELVFLPYVSDVALLPDLSERQVWIRHKTAPAQTCTILTWRMAHSRVLIQIEGCRDLSKAEHLREYEVSSRASGFRPCPTANTIGLKSKV